MCHKCTLYIHRYTSNVHCSVHKLYIKCTSDEGICCMYNVHKKSASKKMLKVHRKYYKSTSQNYLNACQKCTLHVKKMHIHMTIHQYVVRVLQKNDSSKLHDRECFDIFVLFDSFFFGDGQTAVSAPWFLSLNAGRKRQIV